VLAQKNNYEAVIAGIKLVLCCINFEPAKAIVLQPGDRPPRPDTILDRCKGAWKNFKEFTRNATNYVIVHMLMVIRSYYTLVKPEVVGTGFARRMSSEKITKLEDETEETAARLAGDVDLFDEGENGTE
jgi:hypothetical protein